MSMLERLRGQLCSIADYDDNHLQIDLNDEPADLPRPTIDIDNVASEDSIDLGTVEQPQPNIGRRGGLALSRGTKRRNTGSAKTKQQRREHGRGHKGMWVRR